MRTFTFVADAARLQKVLGCCGSLNADYTALVAALARADSNDGPNGGSVAAWDAANELLREAVPDEGDIHPQRGLAEPTCPFNWEEFPAIFPPGATEHGVCVVSAGGVRCYLHFLRPGVIGCHVNFGRDSVTLAGEMLAAFGHTVPTYERSSQLLGFDGKYMTLARAKVIHALQEQTQELMYARDIPAIGYEEFFGQETSPERQARFAAARPQAVVVE